MNQGSPRFWLALAAVLFVFAQGGTEAVADGARISSRPIIFVHGIDPIGIGEDCSRIWNPLESTLSQYGFAKNMITVGYYANDRNCDAMIGQGGSIRTPIENLSHELAWYLYDHFSKKGVAVDVVAHSMGGLMIRYALYRVGISDPNFPPFLSVAHATSMGSPYTGYTLLAELCHLVPTNMQCKEMAPGSSFIEDLKDPKALVPEGVNGTLWSGIGSNADFVDDSDSVVGSQSATSMDIPDTAKDILPWYLFVFHDGYTRNPRAKADVAQSLRITSDQTNVPIHKPRWISPIDPSGLHPDVVLSRTEIPTDLSHLAPNELPARVAEHFVNGRPMGVLFTQVRSDGIFGKMGIRSADVVRGCLNADANAPFEALDDFEYTYAPVVLNFCIVRRGVIHRRQVLVE